jgi:hypothetical protein
VQGGTVVPPVSTQSRTGLEVPSANKGTTNDHMVSIVLIYISISTVLSPGPIQISTGTKEYSLTCADPSLEKRNTRENTNTINKKFLLTFFLP